MGKLGVRGILGVVAVALLACGPARAHRRELESSRLYDHPIFAVTGGLGTYDPDSSPEGTSLTVFGGIRFVKPYEHDARHDFSSTQFTVRQLFSDAEDLTTCELSFSNYLPRTNMFTFDHHFFYGAGLGTAFVERDGQESLSLPQLTLSAGLQSRLKNFDIESSAKLVFAPRRAAYDASGIETQIAIVYPLDY